MKANELMDDELLSRLPDLVETLELSEEEKKRTMALGKQQLLLRVAKVQEQAKRELKMAKGRGIAAKQLEGMRAQKQARCKHHAMTVKGIHTFLTGQTVRGKLLLICQECQKAFSVPPQPNMPSPARELLPPSHWIGGERRPYRDSLIEEGLLAGKEE